MPTPIRHPSKTELQGMEVSKGVQKLEPGIGHSRCIKVQVLKLLQVDDLRQGLVCNRLAAETERFQAFQLFQGIPQVWCRATIHKLHADHDDLVFGPRELELRTQLLESRRCLAFGVVRGSGDGRYEKKG